MSYVDRKRPDQYEVCAPVPVEMIERLRVAGYAVVPLQPSREMMKVGAPHCFQPADAQDDETWLHALSDADACYRVMVEVGCL